VRDCKFQISPGAFFQVNTIGAELLYGLVVDKIREVSPEPDKMVLFDVCCGTGTIGLTCMKEGVVGKVVGVDISEPAIEDAKRNAELNNLATKSGESTVRFVASRAEDVLMNEIKSARRSGVSFVAVVDPAREGLHAEVVKTLRCNEQIERLVYVSCNPTTTLVRDAALLCAPPTKRYSGCPFRVTSATPVDMFPYTNHCEMVMTFDRVMDVGKAT
jgi:tRNA (uracil-5-)-methyltransferase